jgi:hypothetical protein
MQLPHWLMVAGAVLVVIGFIGLAVQKNYAGPVKDNPETPPDEPGPARPMPRQTRL